jgi:hypothetical protein
LSDSPAATTLSVSLMSTDRQEQEPVMSRSSRRPRSTGRELALDVALPLGLYFLLHAGLGVGLVTSLVLSSIPPLVRTVVGVIRDREIKGLAALMLAVNLAGIAVTFVSGDARLLFIRNSAVSGVVAASVLISVAAGRPLMSGALKLFMAKDHPARNAAWDRLSAESAEFHRLELRYSAVWGVLLLAECAARVIGAFTLPVSTMAWASDVLIGVATTTAAIASGALCVPRMEMLLRGETGAGRWRRPLNRPVAACPYPEA